MLLKIAKTTTLVALAACSLNAGQFNAQAEKDRIALIKYMEAKFADPLKNRDTFFPYSTDDELKNNIAKNLKFQDFSIGNYAFSKQGKFSYDQIKEMPPYEDVVDAGEELYNNNKAIQKCFPDVTVVGNYPYFDEKRGEVISLTSAINECLVAAGQKKWNEKKGNMAILESYFASATTRSRKKS